MRRVSSTVALAFVFVSLAAVPADADFARPQADIPLVYRSGLEPGSVLAGFTLPMDWSRRESPCPSRTARSMMPEGEADPARPPLCPGDASDAVLHLQWLLAEKRLYREPFTGVYDEATRYAVVTFHKIIGPARSDPRTAVAEWLADPPPEDWSVDDWALLEAFAPRAPQHRRWQPDRIEVDVGHQVLYLIEGYEVAAIMPVSTGNGRGTVGCTNDGCSANVTPRTSRMENGSAFYYQHRYTRGWSPREGAWSIYKAIFYRGQHGEWNYGIHGYRDVPSHPASHGCIRVTVWDMDFLRPWAETGGYADEEARVAVGMPVHVWDA